MAASALPAPNVIEITLRKKYRFMYENFVIATQNKVYLFMEKHEDLVDVLIFDSANMRYGPPNDEARGGHPLSKHGLGFYGIYEVENSPWIREQMVANRVHERHQDGHFEGKKHYVACFKDVMLEIICRTYQEKQMTIRDIESLVGAQLDDLSD